ncbi:MAG: hypothetical protein JXA66_08360 [Oligoflexia bacterium]|nr:hypothetical protein [Oligoflexia bacterium]
MDKNEKTSRNENTARDPRKILSEITTEIRESGKFGKREAIYLLLEELMKEQLGESN